MHNQVFISGVWHSGTSLIAEIAKLNGYDLGKATNSKNDNNFAWRGPINSLGSSSGYFSKDHDNDSLKGILEKSWPFDDIDEEENKLFRDCVLKSRDHFIKPKYNCCKLPGLSLMTPHISKIFPEAPIIHVLRNPIDLSLSETDNYFLGHLVHDKVKRQTKEWETTSSDTVSYLFTALGGLEWPNIKILPASLHIDTPRKKLLWNLLYTLRWILIIDRLKLDLEKHNIKNHYIVNFEKIVLGDQEELLRLKNILGVSGPLKMPTIDKSKAYKYESYLPYALASDLTSDVQLTFKTIYEVCEPYLEEFGYERVSEFIKKQDFINA